MPYRFAEPGTPPAHLFSAKQIPPSPLLRMIRPGLHRWIGLDSEARYRERPHPVLRPDSVEYRINSHGYRTAELDRASEIGANAVRVVCIGSSGAFGAGLPEEATFPVVFSKLLGQHLAQPVAVWNLSMGGTGPDYVTRMLFSAISVLAPHVILLTTFPFNRREFIGETGRIFVASGHTYWQQRLTDPGQWEMDNVCRKTCNPSSDLVNVLTNLKVWESFCDDASIPWLFTTEAYSTQMEPLAPFLREPRKLVGPGIHALIKLYRTQPTDGLARDMRHAGIRPNREIAAALLERLIELYPCQIAALPAKSIVAPFSPGLN